MIIKKYMYVHKFLSLNILKYVEANSLLDNGYLIYVNT